MKNVWITEAATVTSLGNNLEQLWQNLLAGKTGIKKINRFPVKNYKSNVAAIIDHLDSDGKKSAIHLLIDLILEQLINIPEDTILLTSTTKSGIDNIEKIGHKKKADSKDVLLSTVTDTISKKLGLKDKGVNISAACASSTIAVTRGASLISSGKAKSVLIVCMDLVNEFVFSGFSCLKAMSPEPARPFDIDRCGLTLGEGAAAILLMNEDTAKKNSRKHLGTISGWGIANDATHITAPARDGCGLIQAINKAINKAGIKKNDIAAINAHGTGTVHNDLMELTSFKNVFHHMNIPIHSVKGSIGHTLGAAGGIEVALCQKILFEQILPPTVGLKNPVTGSENLVKPEMINIYGDYILSTNSGFGGINAAVIVKKGKI